MLLATMKRATHKLGHLLNKIGDFILCRAIAALATLNKSKFNQPSTIPFTHDVQLLHQHLEKKIS